MDQRAWAEYVVKQRITPMANVYSVQAGHDGELGLAGYVRQKRLKLREEIIFFADESQQRPVFRIKARKVFDLGARYDVLDEQGRIGVFGKAFRASLTRSTWVVYDPPETGELLRVQERSKPIAIVRRLWDFIPYIGDIPFPVRYHFDVLGGDGRPVGSYDKITTFRDHYRLTLNEPPPVDVRVLLGVAIALDALQSR